MNISFQFMHDMLMFACHKHPWLPVGSVQWSEALSLLSRLDAWAPFASCAVSSQQALALLLDRFPLLLPHPSYTPQVRLQYTPTSPPLCPGCPILHRWCSVLHYPSMKVCKNGWHCSVPISVIRDSTVVTH